MDPWFVKVTVPPTLSKTARIMPGLLARWFEVEKYRAPVPPNTPKALPVTLAASVPFCVKTALEGAAKGTNALVVLLK